MKLYQITLPTHSTRGFAYAAKGPTGPFAQFEHACLHVAGGYTVVGEVAGAWFNGTDNRVELDQSLLYQIACEPDQWAELVAYAKRQWADQACLAVATLGDFELV